MKHSYPNKNTQGARATIITVAMFLAVLLLVVFGTGQLSVTATEEGVAATRQAIERAAILCYASEGFYPPSLSYIEENYGVQIDRENYVVYYEVFASNIMPIIKVSARPV